MTFSGFTLSGGNAANGGQLLAKSGSIVTLDHMVLTGGVAGTNGGCVMVDGAVLISDGTSFTSCSATSGGAIYAQGQSGVVLRDGSFVSGCHAELNGGGIAEVDPSDTLDVWDSTLEGNTAEQDGGALYTVDHDVDLSNATSSGNSAYHGVGGSVAALGDSSVSVTTTQFEGDSSPDAGGAGGAIAITGTGTLDISGGEISSAHSGGLGGAIYADAGLITLTSALIDAGTAGDKGGNLYLEGGSGAHLTGTSAADATSVNGGIAYNDGGNIYSAATEAITVDCFGGDSTKDITSGEATFGNGGNVYLASGAALVTGGTMGCRLENGSASQGSGGSIYAATGSTVTLSGGPVAMHGGAPSSSFASTAFTQVSGNALYGGGAIYAEGATIDLTNVVVHSSEGSVSLAGGAVLNGTNSWITGNTSGDTVKVVDSTFAFSTDAATCPALTTVTVGATELLRNAAMNEYCSVFRDNAGSVLLDASGTSTLSLLGVALHHTTGTAGSPTILEVGSGSSASMTSVLVAMNDVGGAAGEKDGLIHSGGSAVLDLSTFADDDRPLVYEAGSAGSVTDSIFWRATRSGQPPLDITAVPSTLTGSCVAGEWAQTGATGFVAGTDPNYPGQAPKFVDPNTAHAFPDFRLQSTSLDKNLCSLLASTTTDLDTLTRPVSTGTEPGAFELQ